MARRPHAHARVLTSACQYQGMASTPVGAGRPRDPRIDAAVREATLRLLDRDGYAELSIGQVARTAGVPRSAIYRRWPSKRHLVLDALAETIGVHPTPSSGDLRRDLVAGIDTIRQALAGSLFGRILPAFLADLTEDSELREQFLTEIFIARRQTTATALRAAVDRGELRDDLDMEYVLDALAAPLYFRALFRHARIDKRLVELTVDSVLKAIVVAAPTVDAGSD